MAALAVPVLAIEQVDVWDERAALAKEPAARVQPPNPELLNQLHHARESLSATIQQCEMVSELAAAEREAYEQKEQTFLQDRQALLKKVAALSAEKAALEASTPTPPTGAGRGGGAPPFAPPPPPTSVMPTAKEIELDQRLTAMQNLLTEVLRSGRLTSPPPVFNLEGAGLTQPNYPAPPPSEPEYTPLYSRHPEVAAYTEAADEVYGPWKHPIYDWMLPPSGTLLGFNDTVFAGAAKLPSVDVLFNKTPALNDKSSMQLFYKGFEEPTLLRPFVDTVMDLNYYPCRKELVSNLYMVACTKKQGGRGENEARVLVERSLHYFATTTDEAKGQYSRLQHVLTDYRSRTTGDESAGEALMAFFQALDFQFRSPSRGTAKQGYQSIIDKLTLDLGVSPSAALARVHELALQRFGDRKAAWQETCDQLAILFQGQVGRHKEALSRFVDAVSEPEFEPKGYEHWARNFKAWELAGSSASALAVALSKVRNPGGGGMPAPPPVVPKPTKPSPGLDSQISGILGAGGRSSSRNAYDDQWVQSNGCPGFPAPAAPPRERWPLKLRRVCRHMGLAIPESCPTVRGVSSGPGCPACVDRGIAEGDWYVHPNDSQFNTVGGGRVRPSSGTGIPQRGTAFYHNASTCLFLWVKVHQWVKAHPADTFLFDRVPAEENAFADE